MAKLKPKELPDTLDGLREALAKLKDKEARLEADLAIKEHPELEHHLATIVLRFVEWKRATAGLEAMKPTDAGQRKQVEALQRQLEFYQAKVEDVRAALADAGAVKNHELLAGKQNLARDVLRHACDEAGPELVAAGVRMVDLLPSLEDFISETKGE